MLVKDEKESTGVAINSLPIYSNVNSDYSSGLPSVSNILNFIAEWLFMAGCVGLLSLALVGGV